MWLQMRLKSLQDTLFPTQDHQDTLLEIQRGKALDRAAVSIQRVMRGYRHRY